MRWASGLAVSLITLLPFVQGSNYLEILDGVTGKLKIPAEISQYVGKRVKGAGDKGVTLVSAVGSKSSGKSTLLNRLFETDFVIGRQRGKTTKGELLLVMYVFDDGICLASGDAGSLLCLDVDGLDGRGDEEDATSSGRLLALAAQTSDVVLYNIWSSDIGRNLAYNTRALRVLFQEPLHSETPHRTLLTVVVHDHDSDGDQLKTKEAILADLHSIWASVPKGDDKAEADLSDWFDVEVAFLPHPRYQPNEYNEAVQALRSRIADQELANGRYSKGLVKDGWGQQLSALWAEIKSREFPALPSRLELYMTYQIEATHSRITEAAERKLARWKATVDRGWVVGGFGEAAAALLSSSLEEFDRETQPLGLSPLRVKKHEELETTIMAGIQALTRKQLSNLQAQGLKRFKSSLVKLVGKDERENEEILAQEALEAWFEEAASAVVVPGVFPSFNQALTEFVAQLTEYAQKWPTSPAYNVQAMKRLEKRSKKRPGKPTYGMSFQLVGHVRVPGRGNLQGFTTYQAGPLQLLFGFQNDRSLLSSRFEGKPPPLLRLQPKVALDIDL